MKPNLHYDETLLDNRDKFEPATFATLGRAVFAEAPVRSPVHRTAWRFVEQLADRL